MTYRQMMDVWLGLLGYVFSFFFRAPTQGFEPKGMISGTGTFRQSSSESCN